MPALYFLICLFGSYDDYGYISNSSPLAITIIVSDSDVFYSLVLNIIAYKCFVIYIVYHVRFLGGVADLYLILDFFFFPPPPNLKARFVHLMIDTAFILQTC